MPLANRLAVRAAEIIRDAFDAYHQEFKQITRRARSRFEQQDWAGTQGDAVARLGIYSAYTNQAMAALRELLGDQIGDRSVWLPAKRAFAALCAGRDDFVLAETFYNSAVRHLFVTQDVDTAIVYVDNEIPAPPLNDARSVYRSYGHDGSTAQLLMAILCDYAFDLPYQNLERDAQLAASVIDADQAHFWPDLSLDIVDMARPVFYRNKGAYLIGRIRLGNHLIPLIISLLNEGQGITVDSVLLSEDEASIVFSFTRSYFQVDADRPHELVAFLKSIMPLKRPSELYTSLGYNKHGKTELYRRLNMLLATTEEQFEAARGEPGLVMAVFTMPSLAVVFKIIKDRFGFPKNTSRQYVMNRYNLVFRHDRAGRLADAQEFEYLRFKKDRFAPELLKQLLKLAGKTVLVDGEWVVIKHCYTERKMTPLNLFVREAGPEAARAAVIDFGQAIKDLAATNIFPGDVLLKNFGVTRHGRVIFYDYDELCLLTDCTFREMPASQSYDEELSAEPWFYVGEHDIFPEEFRRFLGLPADLREIFEQYHADIFDPVFWRAMQERHRAGEIIDLFPYSEAQRLHNE